MPGTDTGDVAALSQFSAPVRAWFERSFGHGPQAGPTPPQGQGWPAIARGDNTLILAPTGSGKTLTAFLWGIDEIYRELAEEGGARNQGVRLLYISPLKALNNDIERNLRAPLAGIRAEAERLGQPLPPLRVAVRTGDTPASARQSMVRLPPHILITTPESLYLILTSPRGRDMLRTVRSVIVDEIHTLVGEKRGVHLALSLERLEHLAGHRIQRIGLSATVRPLEEAAHFLVGQDDQGQPRPVTIIDTGYKKPLDLKVVMPVENFRDLPGDSIWPSVIPQVLGDVMRHRTTLIFANNRRLAERTADRLNAQIAAERSEVVEPGSTEVLAPGGVMRDKGIFALGAEGPIKAHHGSTSKESRREMEEALKAGRLPALVSTGTLELGIDIGAVDLVVQLQAPRSVSQGLQRIGRSGHLVGQTSKGRIYATHKEDLVEAAAVVRGMLDGAVEETRAPANALDVLAQQIIAAVAVDEWDADALYALVRRAYPYRDLPRSAWESVLGMISGRFQSVPGPGHASLQARVAWDRTNTRLAALPGTRLLALNNPGTIPDTGAYDVYLADGKTRVGTLDEEFIFETRPGDVFMLGSSVWRVEALEDDRVIVGDAAGQLPRMPFWKGDYPWRSYELGERIGVLRRVVAERIAGNPEDRDGVVASLQRDYALDLNSARALYDYVKSQLDALGAISSDQTIIVETFFDAVGEARVVVHSPFGGRINGAWALALVDALKERIGIEIESQVSDDGILLRLPGVVLGAQDQGTLATGVPHEDAFAGGDLSIAAEVVGGMSVREARQRILRELPNSAVFGARFRVDAGRALLLPRSRGHKRTPFWLQRMKARDLLATVRNVPDFPIMAETYRDCLRDVMDLGHLDGLLTAIEEGRVKVLPVHTRVPSPLAAGLLYQFISTYMYEWDTPKAEQQLQSLAMRRELIEDLLEGSGSGRLAIKPEAVETVVGNASHTAAVRKARTAEELSVLLLELGDLTDAEIAERSASDPHAWLADLSRRGTIQTLAIPTTHGSEPRWVSTELAAGYGLAFGLFSPQTSEVSETSDVLRRAILTRWLRWAGPVTRAAILDRYAFDSTWLDTTLGAFLSDRSIVQGHFVASGGEFEYCDRQIFEQLYRRTLNLLRREVQPVSLPAYQAFLLKWQNAGQGRASGSAALAQALHQLRGLAIPASTWEREVLPARGIAHPWRDLDSLVERGDYAWVAAGAEGRADLRFIARREGALFLTDPLASFDDGATGDVFAYLKSEGPSFFADIQGGTRLGTAALREALRRLALAGIVTGEDMVALSALSRGRDEPADQKPMSRLEEDLAQRLPPQPLGRTRGGARPSQQRLREQRRLIGQRLQAESESEAGWGGRWALVNRAAIMGPALRSDERAAAFVHVALERYGLLTPEIVARFESRWTWADETPAAPSVRALWEWRHEQTKLYGPREIPWSWGELSEQLGRMELRGEVRRGYFVSGLSGVQYALPQAVESLREARDGLASSTRVVLLSAMDPVNLYGGELGVLAAGATEAAKDEREGDKSGSGEAKRFRFARVASTHLVLHQGAPVLVGEDNGTRLSASDVSDEVLREALKTYLDRQTAPRRLAINTWNDGPVIGSRGEALLRELGATRSPVGLDYWRNT
jgi:ATP-dependent helicase Lhr and Lhr-like helicase